MTSITTLEFHRPRWRTIVLSALAFWLSSSLIVDLVIMPTMYAAGMMTEPNFATAGYSLFWIFNRVELLCAALVLTGVFVLCTLSKNQQYRWAVPLALALLAISLNYTYGLTPEMGALGIHLNSFESAAEIPVLMNQMHEQYWLLEVLKLVAGGVLLGAYYKQQNN